MPDNTAESVTIDCFGLTDTGRVRSHNEDHFVIAAIAKSIEVRRTSLPDKTLSARFGSASAHLFAVADGVGGRPDGERASELTVGALLDYVAHAAGCFQGLDADKEHALLETLERTVRDVHERLLGEARGDAEKSPATTLTMVLLAWPRAYLVHVGDSRVYACRGGKLELMTRDQTIGEYMLSMGAWTEAQARRSGPAAALASAVGGSELAPVVGVIELAVGDALLLCTDGLNRHVPDDQIGRTIAEATSAEAATRALVDLALAGGGSDNVTAVVARAVPAPGGSS